MLKSILALNTRQRLPARINKSESIQANQIKPLLMTSTLRILTA